jgi:hypothetical protein
MRGSPNRADRTAGRSERLEPRRGAIVYCPGCAPAALSRGFPHSRLSLSRKRCQPSLTGLLPIILLLDSTTRSLLLSHGLIGTLANSQPHQAVRRCARGVAKGVRCATRRACSLSAALSYGRWRKVVARVRVACAGPLSYHVRCPPTWRSLVRQRTDTNHSRAQHRSDKRGKRWW